MLFAAGFGTRMGALTANRPKPLIEVAGRPLIDHALDLAEGMGLTIIANAHYHADQIVAHLAGRDVTVIREDPILETGGGLRNALPLLGEGPVFTLNTDAVWTGPNPLAALAEAWRDGMGCLQMVLPAERATGHSGSGDWDMDADGRLTRGLSYIYTGAQIVDLARLAEIPEKVFSFNKLWDLQIPDGQLCGLVHQGGWCDVGRPESIPLAEALLDV